MQRQLIELLINDIPGIDSVVAILIFLITTPIIIYLLYLIVDTLLKSHNK
jgi:hypothetical protein